MQGLKDRIYYLNLRGLFAKLALVLCVCVCVCVCMCMCMCLCVYACVCEEGTSSGKGRTSRCEISQHVLLFSLFLSSLFCYFTLFLFRKYMYSTVKK